MKLFHCIVVMGAAIGEGCGGEERTIAGAEAGHSDAGDLVDASGASLESSTCPTPPSLEPAMGCSSTCRGTAAAPRSPQDCPQPQELQCGPGTCTCDLTSPLQAGDCSQTGQFVCDDWTTPCGCRCNLDAGVDPVACCGDAAVAMDANVACGNPSTRRAWSCYSYDPPVGCDCRIVVAIL
jgi:hypothetical protein